jgi:hypothetical protein
MVPLCATWASTENASAHPAALSGRDGCNAMRSEMSFDGQGRAERMVIRLEVTGGGAAVRDSLGWRLANGIPQCNLVAANGNGSLVLLVPAQSAMTRDAVQERIGRMVDRLNEFHPSEIPLRIDVVPHVDAVLYQRATA